MLIAKMTTKVKHLVVDSAGFIKNAAFHEYAEFIYSIYGVVNEIKDKATRQRLQVLPYTLKLQDPRPESIRYVTEFSKKTGDYPNLSATDLKLIALTYELEKEHVGTDHLNSEPSCEISSKIPESQTPVHGFYCPKDDKDDTNYETSKNSFNSLKDLENDKLELEDEKNEIEHKCDNEKMEIASDNEKIEIASDNEKNAMNNSEKMQNKTTTENHVNLNNYEVNPNSLNKTDEFNDDSETDVSDDGETWITPQNLGEIKKKMGSLLLDDSANCVVGCLTTDYAIQNVLLQMGLRVVSIDGMLIRCAKVFALRCHSCFKTTTTMTSKFCKNCGNKTLKRVAVYLNEDGTKSIYINFKRPINIRGTKYSLPKPQGGKHAQNPHLCADQPFPHNRPSKAALKKIDVWSPDYCDGTSSPFTIHDIYSRAAALGIYGHTQQKHSKRNPNERKKYSGNKKNRK